MRRDEEFAEIFRESYPSLCRFLECLLGKHHLAQDIAQESFLRLYKQGLESIPAGEARFWLFRVARNLALNELNKTRRHQGFFQQVKEMYRAKPDTPETDLLLSEEKRAVIEMLKTLPEQQRATLLLREQEGLSYSEIARVLNVSESKVKVDIFRARNSLRAHWHAAHAAINK